ncbi:MAG: WG repeat-containing protein [Clostridia bacterium]|nr:WG repeat-containing protein [Clostridia bacterium]
MKRRFAAICLAVLLCAAPFAARADLNCTSAIDMDTGSVLLAGDGTVLTDEYAQLLPLIPGERFAGYTEDGACYLLNETGQRVTDRAFETLLSDNGRTILFTVGQKTGVLDGGGNEIIPASYTQIVPCPDGCYLALTGDPYDAGADGVYHLDASGEESPTGARVLYGLGYFESGLMAACAPDGRMGYLGADGEWAIRPQFEYAGDFYGSYAEASVESGSGMIDKSGNWRILPKYTVFQKSPTESGVMIGQTEVTSAVLFDPETFGESSRIESGEVYFSAYYDNGLAAVYLSDSTQLIDARGTVLLDLPVDANVDTWRMMGQRAIVQSGEWGDASFRLYDFSGRVVTGPWQEIQALGQGTDGKALFACIRWDVTEEVDIDLGWRMLEEVPDTREIAILDEDGAERMPAARLDEVEKLDGGLLLRVNGRVRVVDESGKTLFQEETEEDEA